MADHRIYIQHLVRVQLLEGSFSLCSLIALACITSIKKFKELEHSDASWPLHVLAYTSDRSLVVQALTGVSMAFLGEALFAAMMTG